MLASDELLAEEYLIGRELSVFALCDRSDFLLMPACADHKKAGAGDRGPQYRRHGCGLPGALRGHYRDGEDRAGNHRADLPGHGGRRPIVSRGPLLRDHADRRGPKTSRI